MKHSYVLKDLCYFLSNFNLFFARMSNKTDVGLTSPDRYYRGSPSSNLVLAICEFQYFYSFLAVILFAAN